MFQILVEAALAVTHVAVTDVAVTYYAYVAVTVLALPMWPSLCGGIWPDTAT
jgi:hypothetical protein